MCSHALGFEFYYFYEHICASVAAHAYVCAFVYACVCARACLVVCVCVGVSACVRMGLSLFVCVCLIFLRACAFAYTCVGVCIAGLCVQRMRSCVWLRVRGVGNVFLQRFPLGRAVFDEAKP